MGFRSHFGLSSGEDDLKGGQGPGSRAGQLICVSPPQLSQHMKLKLQFTASVSHPPPEARPLSRKSSPSSPAVRDLVERHQASLGRSQSFSHQQPSRSHLMRYEVCGEGPAGLVEAGIGKGAGRDPGVWPEPIASTFLQVGQCDGAPGHHAPRGLPCRPPPLPAPGQGCALSGQDRQTRVQGPGGGAGQVDHPATSLSHSRKWIAPRVGAPSRLHLPGEPPT